MFTGTFFNIFKIKWINGIIKKGSDNMKNYDLIRTVIMFIYYMFSSVIFNKIFSLFGLDNTIISIIIADVIFFIAIVTIYKEKLKADFNKFKSEYSTKNKIWAIIKWILIILTVNILMGILTEIFYPELADGIDQNTSAVAQLFDVSFLYSLFKTLIFAPIAEELLFKESIRNVIKNDIAFIVISSSIYTAMNFIYSSSVQYLDLLGYFTFSSILSLAYIRNNNNIVIVMFIKLFYNIIPTLMLIITMIAGVAA